MPQFRQMDVEKGKSSRLSRESILSEDKQDLALRIVKTDSKDSKKDLMNRAKSVRPPLN